MFRRSISRLVQNYARKGMSPRITGGKSSIDLPMSNQVLVDQSSSGNLVTDGSGARPFRDYSQNPDRIARLYGYLEALRCKRECYHALSDMKYEKNFRPINYDLAEEDDVLPENFPFPVETCNLDDLIHLNALQTISALKNVDMMGLSKNVDLFIDIMRDLIHKVGGFHYSGMIHGNLEPQNVLVFEGECMLTSFVNDGCDSLGWKAPEQLLYNIQTRASDMFSYGCILYFCITGGYHPFGDSSEERIHNIMANKMDISRAKDMPEAYHLITHLLSPEPELRPKAIGVRSHPFFYYLQQKVVFVADVRSFIEEELDIVLTNALKSNSPMLFDPDWCRKFRDYIRMFCYSKKQPFKDFPDIFGPPGSANFFPSILMSAYEVASKHYKDDKWLTLNYQYDEVVFSTFDNVGFRCYGLENLYPKQGGRTRR